MKFGGILLGSLIALGIACANPGTSAGSGDAGVASEGGTSEPRAMLGVATAAVSPSLRDYLGLDPGFGIQIHDVVPDSPAAQSGLKEQDILTRLDDQLLISPEHLALLINARSPGDTVVFHLIRKGEKKRIEAVLGALDPDLIRAAVLSGPLPEAGENPSLRDRGWEDEMRKQQEIWEGWIRNRIDHGPAPGSSDGRSHREANRDGAGFPIRVFGKEGIVTIDNPRGSVTLVTEGGESEITIRDPDGEILHEGVYDPEKGVEALPEEARELLRNMELGDFSSFSLPPPLRKKISSPMFPPPKPRVL